MADSLGDNYYPRLAPAKRKKWPTWAKVLVWIVAGIIGFCAWLGVLLEPSKAAILRETSADGKHDAVLVEVDAGASADYAYWICVVPKGSEKFNESAFVADGVSEKGEFNLGWDGEKLVVWLPKNCREFKRLPKANVGWWQSVDVEYR